MARAMSAALSSSPGLELLPGKDILSLEYEQLNQWARHGEEAAHRIFNFYVSLLTAMLGGFILITQIMTGSLQSILLIGSAIAGLLMIIGVTFLDALMSQYSRNIHYRIGIEKIRACFRQDPAVAAVLSKLPIATLEADAETFFYSVMEDKVPAVRIKKGSWLLRLSVYIFPVSTQQIFLSMVTSLLVGALIWMLLWMLSGMIILSGNELIAIGLAVVLSFVTQNIIVRIALQGPLESLREILSAHSGHHLQRKDRPAGEKRSK